MSTVNSFNSRTALKLGGDRSVQIYSLRALEAAGFPEIARLPFSLKILLENLLRQEDGRFVKRADIEALARWDVTSPNRTRFRSRRRASCCRTSPAFPPSSISRPCATGSPRSAAIPTASTRCSRSSSSSITRCRSITSASANAFQLNAELEFSRNKERYAFLRWGQNAFRNFRVVPPDTGIVHQVNLEYLARVVVADVDGGAGGVPRHACRHRLAYDDGQRTRCDGLGRGRHRGRGRDARSAHFDAHPEGARCPAFRRDARRRHGDRSRADGDRKLRKHGVVGKFVEFFGPGLAHLTIADRATLGNMCPEYGATIAIFPIDDMTLDYLRLTGARQDRVELVEAYARAQGLFRNAADPEPKYSETIDLDLGTIEPSLAGPKRPQDRVSLKGAKSGFQAALADDAGIVGQEGAEGGARRMRDERPGGDDERRRSRGGGRRRQRPTHSITGRSSSPRLPAARTRRIRA